MQPHNRRYSGIVVATSVDGTLVNYGTPQQPRIASFEDTVEIVNTDDSSSARLFPRGQPEEVAQ